MRKSFQFCFWSIFLLFTLAACKEEKNTDIPIENLIVKPVQRQMHPGDTIHLSVQLLPIHTTERRLTYVSTNPSVATVENGIITAVGGGYTEIRVTNTDRGMTASFPLWVSTELPEGMQVKDSLLTGHPFLTLEDSIFVFPDTIRSIGEDALRNQPSLRKIILPPHLANINRNAFNGCTGLTEIEIPGTLTTSGSWGSNLFEGCTSLRKVVIGEGVTAIGNYAFRNDSLLEEIILPTSLTTIRTGAFVNCTSLKEIRIPQNVTTLSASLFSGAISLEKVSVAPENTALTSIGGAVYSKDKATLLFYVSGNRQKSISLEEGLATISTSAFINAHLETVVFPSTLTKIGLSAFEKATALRHIEFQSVTPPSISFGAFNKKAIVDVYVPAGTASAYQAKFKTYTNYRIVEKQ